MSNSSEQQNTGSVSLPGQRLKQRREQKQLSLDQVSEALHLRPSIVTAIEEDNYDQLPGVIFLKGYVRTYSRLLEIDESEIIKLLDLQLADQLQVEEKRMNQVRKPKNNLFVGAGIVTFVLILIIGVVWEWPHIKSIFISTIESSKQVTASGKTTKPELSAVKTVEKKNSQQKKKSIEVTGNTRKQVTPKKKKPVLLPGNRLHASIVFKTTPAVTFPGKKKKSLVNNTATITPSLSFKTKAPLKAVSSLKPVLKNSKIQISFTGNSWFEMKNGEGKRVFAALEHAGETLSYEGITPFSLVVGATDVTKITYNGKQVDYKRFRVWNNRAAFQLN